MSFLEGTIFGMFLMMAARRVDEWRSAPRCPACNQVNYSGVCPPCLDKASRIVSVRVDTMPE
jgi:hypothetical protein